MRKFLRFFSIQGDFENPVTLTYKPFFSSNPKTGNKAWCLWCDEGDVAIEKYYKYDKSVVRAMKTIKIGR